MKLQRPESTVTADEPHGNAAVSMRSRADGCVYCGRDGPYNDEHVVPAGLGASNSMLLKQVVCKPCNDAFSKLEVRVLRRGDTGFGRLALQEHGRARGGKTRALGFEAASAQLMTDDGRSLEVALGHRLAATVLPQITQYGQVVQGEGSDRAQIERFLGRLEALLTSAKVILVRKRISSAARHTAIELELGPAGFVGVGTYPIENPQATPLWIEEPEHGASANCPRVVERGRDSIGVQVPGGQVAAASAFLSLLKQNLPSLRAALAGPIEKSSRRAAVRRDRVYPMSD